MHERECTIVTEQIDTAALRDQHWDGVSAIRSDGYLSALARACDDARDGGISQSHSLQPALRIRATRPR